MTSHPSSHDHHHDHAPTAVPDRPAAQPDAHHVPSAAPPHVEHGGHDRHAGHSVEMFRDRFWITLALTVPTLIWSEMIQRWFGFRAPEFPGSAYIPAVFGTAVYLYGG